MEEFIASILHPEDFNGTLLGSGSNQSHREGSLDQPSLKEEKQMFGTKQQTTEPNLRC